MRHALRTSLFAALLVLGTMACETKEEPLPEGLSAAYADLLSFRNASQSPDSASYAQGVDSILALHGYDRESFSKSFGKLGSSPDQVNDFFGETSQRLIPLKPPKQAPQ